VQAGQDQELNGEVVPAFATYEKALVKFPQSQSLEIAAGRLAASLERYEDAARLLEQAQNRDTPNSVIAYYLGIAEEGLGYAREAETSYEIAYRRLTYVERRRSGWENCGRGREICKEQPHS